MNYINLPKDIKNIIGLFLFDEIEHNINKNKCLAQLHIITNTSCWYEYRGKSILRFLYERLNSKLEILEELNEIYIKTYQDKIDYYEYQKVLNNRRHLKERREKTKLNKIAKKLRRNKQKQKKNISVDSLRQ